MHNFIFLTLHLKKNSVRLITLFALVTLLTLKMHVSVKETDTSHLQNIFIIIYSHHIQLEFVNILFLVYTHKIIDLFCNICFCLYLFIYLFTREFVSHSYLICDCI